MMIVSSVIATNFLLIIGVKSLNVPNMDPCLLGGECVLVDNPDLRFIMYNMDLCNLCNTTYLERDNGE